MHQQICNECTKGGEGERNRKKYHWKPELKKKNSLYIQKAQGTPRT